MPRPWLALPFAALFTLPATPTRAEEPIVQRFSYGGNIDFFATGAAMAADGPDPDTTRVDYLLHPAITEITPTDLPANPSLRAAFLYWGGSIKNDDCNGTTIDDTVTFAPPGQPAMEVTAEVCYCSDGGAQSYDIQLCRANVTQMIDALVGEYAVDEFDAQIQNGATDNASFSIVLVFTAPSLPARRIGIYDGLLTMWNQSNPLELVVLNQVEIDNPPVGDLTWYGLEGDVGGTGTESVSVVGKPGNLGLALTDAINPINNPFNHTINTTTPVQTDSLGVDIDQFDISAALTAGDTSVETTYQAGSDKYWIAYNVVGVNVFAPLLSVNSAKTWALQDDADQSGGPSSGDTIRYTILLQNDGNAPGTVNLDDPMPDEVASWTLIADGGGADQSTPDTLLIDGIVIAPGAASEVVFDVVLADAPDGTKLINIASYEAPPDNSGVLVAPPVVYGSVGGDGDGDTGDGDGDTGDGDTGDDGDGDGDGSGESGEGGGDGSSDENGDGNDSHGTGDDAGISDADGCGCLTADRAPLPAAWMLLGLAVVGRRRRIERA